MHHIVVCRLFGPARLRGKSAALARSTGARVLDCPESELRGELESSAQGSERWRVGCEMRTSELNCNQKECRVQSWRDGQNKTGKMAQ
jgi:hypothetical protein